jgi:hypothetical protein
MRYISTFCLLALLSVLTLAMQPSVGEMLPSAPLNPADNAGWLRFIAAREKTMTRVTDKPMSMDLAVASLCRGPMPDELPASNPHRGHFVHVYVTPGEEKKIRTGEGKYPVDTLIVKEKLPGLFSPLRLKLPVDKPPALEAAEIVTAEGRRYKQEGEKQTELPQHDPELFTVMLKREAGYHPECGDWEFMVVSGDAKQVLARGKLDSCVACHKDHKQTDFVTQLYPEKKAATKK